MKKFKFFNLMADETDVEINLYGELVADEMKDLYDWFGINSTAPGEFKELLNSHSGKNLTVRINSIGGDFLVGVELYNAIKGFKGTTVAVIDGIAASAATLPMVACGKVRMSAPATIMIHCASMITEGNKQDLKHDIDVLKTIDTAIVNAYQVKTGLSDDKLMNLLESETWMDCKKAKELGFCDEIDEKLLPDSIVKNIIDRNKQVYAAYRPHNIQNCENAEQESENNDENAETRKENTDTELTNAENASSAFEFIKTKLKFKGVI